MNSLLAVPQILLASWQSLKNRYSMNSASDAPGESCINVVDL